MTPTPEPVTEDGLNLGSVNLLRRMVEMDIEREGETCSTMVRAGLLLKIIDAALNTETARSGEDFGDWIVGDSAADRVWNAIMDDDRLKRARSQLSLHEIRLMVGHAQRHFSPDAAMRVAAQEMVVVARRKGPMSDEYWEACEALEAALSKSNGEKG